MVFKVVSYLLPWRKPILLEGKNSLFRLPKLILDNNINNVLIITDKGITSLGLMDILLEGLKMKEIKFIVYDKTVPNPTIDNIEEALLLYKENNCNGLIAFGGGSPMDCAKGVGARVARPKKSISSMKGVLKVRKRIPLLFAIPTTSGTGSEATLATVITDSKTHEKYSINDISLIPHFAIHDPVLTLKLPQHITSTTGIDALTHAVEAYIGRSNTKETKLLSKKAVKLIFENIYEAYSNGFNIVARENMQKASFYAGVSFTRAYVGYVHAIAHTLGGFYGVPHGLANAIVLPYVLEYYGETVHNTLAELADLVGISKNDYNVKQKSENFIQAIRGLNKSMNIPDKISEIKEEDIPIMVKRALDEANPLYPVPKILSNLQLTEIFYMIKQ